MVTRHGQLVDSGQRRGCPFALPPPGVAPCRWTEIKSCAGIEPTLGIRSYNPRIRDSMFTVMSPALVRDRGISGRSRAPVPCSAPIRRSGG